MCLVATLVSIAACPTSSSVGQTTKSQAAKGDEAARILYVPPDCTPTDKINEADHIDVRVTWRNDQALKSIYILEDIEVLHVRSVSNMNLTSEEKEGTYLVLQLTKPQSIILKYFKERAQSFDVERRKANEIGKVYKEGSIRAFKKSEAQKILDKWIGAWRTVPEGKTGAGLVKNSRFLAEEFVQENIEHPDKTRENLIFTYDSQQKCYRRWQFSATGETVEYAGIWDADKNTMTWTSVGESSSNTTTIHRFVDDENAEWNGVTNDRAGNVLFHTEGKLVRIQAAK